MIESWRICLRVTDRGGVAVVTHPPLHEEPTLTAFFERYATEPQTLGLS